MIIGTIFIDQIKVDAILGIYENERINKQRLLIDIKFDYECKKACQSDKINHAIDYHKITEEIHTYVIKSSYQLIESLTLAIADKVLLNKQINKVQVTVSKPEALTMAKNVSFRLEKYNSC